jgi:nucleoside-diphosphate-sugar epimerase
MTVRLLTGATGLVGGAVVLELLDRTDDEVHTLVRGRWHGEAQRRLHETLAGLAVGYGRPDLVASVLSRTHAVVGDITADGCGVRATALPCADEVWHCAASLRYEERHWAEIEAHNVQGTRNVLGLARRLGAGTFNHVSTAYVAGRQQGRILEEPAPDVAVANNAYERSKIEAERLVQDLRDDMRWRILRPSIVIGHSRTRHGVNWSGMYGFAASLVRFRRHTDRRLGTFLSHARLRLLAEPNIGGNVVPVDHVARNAVAIGLSDSPFAFFHLVNGQPPTVREGVETMMDLVGLRAPLWVDDRDGFTALDSALDAGMDFYRSYLNNGKTFDMRNTDSVCGAAASRVPLSRQDIGEYLLYYLRREHDFDNMPTVPARVVHASVS